MQCDVQGNQIRNNLITISYNGSNYHGWQIQNNALAVQEVFQNALENIIQKTPYEIKGCSRTDSGVHANMYCISLKMAHSIPCHRLLTALNRFLPLDIAVLDVEEKSLDFKLPFVESHGIYNFGKSFALVCKKDNTVTAIFDALKNVALNAYILSRTDTEDLVMKVYSNNKEIKTYSLV